MTQTDAPPPVADGSIDKVEPEVVDSSAFAAAEKEATLILNSLLARIGDVNSNPDPYLKLYIYGAPGAGKTTWCATAPNFLGYNIERGMKVLKGMTFDGHADVIEYTTTYQAKQLVRLLKEKEDAFAKYETFIVDSGSELQQKFNKEIITSAVKNDPSWDITKMPDGGWNQSTQFMKDFFDDLRNLDRHVIVTGHVKEEKDESTGRLLIRPNLTPKVAEAMAGIFDAVLYLERVEEPDGTVKRILRTQPIARPTSITAKTRIKGLDTLLLDSSFDTILDAYNNQ